MTSVQNTKGLRESRDRPSTVDDARARAAIDGHGRLSGELRPAFPELSIITPTYNEVRNIRDLVTAVAEAMAGVAWEIIVVDDDSPDGTAAEAIALARDGFPVRCIRRVGRRGLASAVVEGAMNANADILAVIDADLQHDETALPRMLDILRTSDTDLVVASRHVEGGSMGPMEKGRRRMSDFATWTTGRLIGTTITDPMSGFFMTRREVFEAAIYDLSQQGYKILLDIITSSPRPLKIAEVAYVFRDRRAGESKVDLMIIAEFAFLLVEKLTRGLIPPRFVLFCIIGGIGLCVHLFILNLTMKLGYPFLQAQAIATLIAMAFNYASNNSFTYRTDRLKGKRFVTGYLIFCAVCSVGAIANLGVANLVISETNEWRVAGIAGALMSSVFNFGVATRLVWGRRRTRAVVARVAASS